MSSRLIRRRRNPSRAFDCHHLGRASRLHAGGLLPDGGALVVRRGCGPDGGLGAGLQIKFGGVAESQSPCINGNGATPTPLLI